MKNSLQQSLFSDIFVSWRSRVCVCSFVPRTPIVFLFLFSYSGFTYTFMVIVGYLRINLLENHLRNSMKGIANTLVFVWQYPILYGIRSEKDLVWCNIVLLWCAFLCLKQEEEYSAECMNSKFHPERMHIIIILGKMSSFVLE